MGNVILKRIEEVGKDTQHFMGGRVVTKDQYMAAYSAATKLNFKGASGGLSKSKEKHTVVHEAVDVPDRLIVAGEPEPVAPKEDSVDAEPVAKDKA